MQRNYSTLNLQINSSHKKRVKQKTCFEKIKEFSEAHYRFEVRQEFTWEANYINFNEEELNEDIRKFTRKGLEVFVGNIVFDTKGNQIKKSKVLFTRIKKK